MAARSGQAEVVRYLVQDGAQVEAKAKVCAVCASFATKRRNDFNKTFKHTHALFQDHSSRVMTTTNDNSLYLRDIENIPSLPMSTQLFNKMKDEE